MEQHEVPAPQVSNFLGLLLQQHGQTLCSTSNNLHCCEQLTQEEARAMLRQLGEGDPRRRVKLASQNTAPLMRKEARHLLKPGYHLPPACAAHG
jgi:hypothetical protein